MPVLNITTRRRRIVRWRGPLDLVSWLRATGGIKDFRGELRSLGVNNTLRDIEFASGEQFLGSLVTEDGRGFPRRLDRFIEETTGRPLQDVVR